jgi:hypothetical protein
MNDLPNNDDLDAAQADDLADAIFGNEDNAVETAGLISQFITSYEHNKEKQHIEQWLSNEFRKFPAIWSSEAELNETSREIVQTIQQANDNKAELYAG